MGLTTDTVVWPSDPLRSTFFCMQILAKRHLTGIYMRKLPCLGQRTTSLSQGSTLKINLSDSVSASFSRRVAASSLSLQRQSIFLNASPVNRSSELYGKVAASFC